MFDSIFVISGRKKINDWGEITEKSLENWA